MLLNYIIDKLVIHGIIYYLSKTIRNVNDFINYYNENTSA